MHRVSYVWRIIHITSHECYDMKHLTLVEEKIKITAVSFLANEYSYSPNNIFVTKLKELTSLYHMKYLILLQREKIKRSRQCHFSLTYAAILTIIFLLLRISINNDRFKTSNFCYLYILKSYFNS